MVKAIITLVLISFTTTTSTAQEFEYNVLYDTDKSDIKKIHQSEIKELFKNTSGSDISQITLIGHTDSDASKEYNLDLSKSRVEGVKRFLSDQGIPEELISSSYVGESEPRESNSSPQGKQANRRVQIKILLKPIVEEVEEIVEEVVSCDRDTMIQLPSGGQYSINLCDYQENPECVQINEINSAESMAEAGLTTMSEDNESLISAGMVDYDICDGVEVKFYLPIRQTCETDGMTLWQMTEDGVWQETSREELEPVVVNGQQYYELRLSGRGTKNCDQRPRNPPKPKYRRSRFKVKRNSGLSLQSVTLYCNCPLRGMEFKSKKNKGRKVVYKHLKNRCCSGMRIMIEATDENGDSLIMSQRLLTEIDGNTFMGNCPTTVRNQFLFIRTRNKVLHRKYKIRRKNFNQEL